MKADLARDTYTMEGLSKERKPCQEGGIIGLLLVLVVNMHGPSGKWHDHHKRAIKMLSPLTQEFYFGPIANSLGLTLDTPSL